MKLWDSFILALSGRVKGTLYSAVPQLSRKLRSESNNSGRGHDNSADNKPVMHYDETSKRQDLVIFHYIVALGMPLLALATTSAIQHLVHEQKTFLFVVAVISAAYVGGWRPGIVASLFSVLLLDYFLLEPLNSILADTATLLLMTVFFGVSVFISWIEETRLRTERALRAANLQREIILNGVMDGISAQDITGQPIYANPAVVKMLGLESVRELVERPIEDFYRHARFLDERGDVIPLDDLPSRRALREGVASEMTVRLQRLDGKQDDRWIVIKSAPVFDNHNRPMMSINITRDITERKRAEAERLRLLMLVEQQRVRIQNLLDNVPGIVWEARGKPGGQKVEFVNSYAETMLGYSTEEWMNSSSDIWQKIVHPDDMPSAIEQATSIYQSGQPGSMQFRCITRDRRVIDVEAHTSILLDEKGEPRGACGVMMDVSERKHAEDMLARYSLDLMRSNEELKQFAYVASHDLQEPLRMVASYLQLLERRYADKLDDDAREFIGYAVDGATRMKSLITDLLTYSRVQTQQKALDAVNLEKVLDESLHYLSATIEENQAMITHDPLPVVKGDEGLLRQLLQNLIGNAIKYRRDAPPQIHIGAEKGKNYWQFCVRDNGIGIESQYLDRIFIIFQRLHAKGKYPGTGIGLSICKKVVERHGGRIWAESEIGKGTTFYFTIPVS
jgi:PAS domain S-box-containing protein